MVLFINVRGPFEACKCELEIAALEEGSPQAKVDELKAKMRASLSKLSASTLALPLRVFARQLTDHPYNVSTQAHLSFLT